MGFQTKRLAGTTGKRCVGGGGRRGGWSEGRPNMVKSAHSFLAERHLEALDTLLEGRHKRRLACLAPAAAAAHAVHPTNGPGVLPLNVNTTAG